jgi:hypothetical protein
MEIVGVTAATHNTGIDTEPQPELFASTVQLRGFNNQMFLVLRTQGSPRTILPAVREAVASIDPEQPVYLIQTLEEALSQRQAMALSRTRSVSGPVKSAYGWRSARPGRRSSA